MKKRVISILMALMICLSLLPATAFAEDGGSAGPVADLVYYGGKEGTFSDSPDKTKTLPGEMKVGEPYTLKTAEELGLTGPKNFTFFAGWTLNQESAKLKGYWPEMGLPEIVTQVTAETTDPVTVYAVWDADFNNNGVADREESFTVTFDSNKEVFDECYDTGTNLVLPGFSITMPDPQSLNPSKAVGVGWSLTPCKKLLTIDDDLPEDMVMVNGYKVTQDITFYAVWSLDTDQNGMGDVSQKVRISYEAKGAENVPESTVSTWKRLGTEEPYTYTPLPISDQIPTKEGYEFKGWYNEDLDVHVPLGATSVTLKTFPFSDMPFEAVWERNPGYQIPYSVSFEAEDAEPDEVPETLTKKVDADSCTFTIPEKIPKRKDAEFICWTYFDMEDFQEAVFFPGDEITLTEDHPHITLQARWEKVYRAEFDDFQAIEGTVPETIYISQGNGGAASFTLPETPVPERYYFDFAGYKICLLGEKENPDAWLPGIYYPGEKVGVRSEKDYLVVPQWETQPETIISLTYNADGGSLPEAGIDIRQVASGKAAEFTVTDKIPQRSGYRFKEWNTKKDGTGESYGPNEKLTTYKDTVLYAQWVSNSAVPGKPGTSDKPGTPSDPNAPDTGDSTQKFALIALALLSGTAAAAVWKRRHSKA